MRILSLVKIHCFLKYRYSAQHVSDFASLTSYLKIDSKSATWENFKLQSYVELNPVGARLI